MPIHAENVGAQIASLRKAKGLTQAQLGERLGVTFQAVSKWERGETLPDIGTLPDLAAILETSVDTILCGGEQTVHFRGKNSVSRLREGLECLGNMGKLLGKDNLIYRSAVEGINTRMNTDIEAAFSDDYAFEAFLAEAVIQNLMAGYYIDLTDLKNGFRNDHFRQIVLQFAEKYGIK